jgi:hypothetical protein
MREPGYDDFADLWQDPADEQQEAFEALARKARRQGRLMGYADLALAVLIVGGMLLGIFMTPHPAMIGVGLALIGATLWVTWKRRQLRQMATTLNAAGRAAFLESSIRITTANLRRVTLSLAWLPLAIVGGLTARFIFRSGGHLEHPLTSVSEWASSPRGMAALTIFALIFISSLRSRTRLRAELRRLEQLRSDYEEEYANEES